MRLLLIINGLDYKIMRIAAVVVTYNRKELLFKQIVDVVENQSFKVDEYYVIDNNSTDDTEVSVLQYSKCSPVKLTYVKLTNNVGGAGGFYYGLKKAFEDGYDWIILMDDDGRPYDDKCFSSIVEFIKGNSLNASDLHFINSLVLFTEDTLSFGLNHIEKYKDIIKLSEDGLTIKGFVNPFNGACVSKGLVGKIGFPNKDFFIKGDEYDYTLRALGANANVVTLLTSRYFHPKVMAASNRKILGRVVHVHMEAPWKEYYTIRNFTFTMRQIGKPFDCWKYLLLRFYCLFVFKCDKIKTAKMIIMGFLHGLRGHLGPIVKP